MKILVLNGPNLNMLGVREPDIYGKENYASLCKTVEDEAKRLGIQVDIRQSNHEGQLVDWIQEAFGVFDGIVINPAAYTHYSIAILDALKAVGLPAVEVHISDIHKREDFRKHSVTAPACIGQISGKGIYGYVLGIRMLYDHING
ncbi:MAG: type II 3-dehydroquinate dehydratase [Clostridia bacterium]|jgi:3-dehydroquinate dehydratase-2|nr:type II 3-dehydroquinate dehydratase [Clostridiaceae bacterium]